MINKTPNPIPLIPEQELLARFKAAVYAAGEYDLARRAEGKTSTTMSPIHIVLNEWLNHADSLTENDLSTIYRFFDAFSGARKSEKDMAKAQDVLKINGVCRSNLLCVNSRLKHVFISLWVQKAVLLPMSFTIGTTFPKDELRDFLPAFAMCSYHNKKGEVGALGLKLVLASTWYSFADFDIDECGDFAMFFENKENRQLIGAPGNYNRYASSILTGVLRTWTKHGQDQGFAYSDADISNFIYWAEVARRNDTQLKPSEFIPQANMRRRRVMAQSRLQHRRKKDAAQVDLIEHHEKSDLKAKVLAGDMTLQAAQLYALLNKGPIQYIRYIRVKSGTRLSISGDYPFRMHVYPEEIWIKWNSCFDSYFDYRARQGFERTGAWETFRYIFQDYLCCYLPWWAELNPSSEVVIPADPSVFFRFGFWVAGQPDRAAPDPLLNFHRDTRGGMSGVVNTSFMTLTASLSFAGLMGLIST